MNSMSNIREDFNTVDKILDKIKRGYTDINNQNSRLNRYLDTALAERDIYKKLYNDGNVRICMITISTIGIGLSSIIKGSTLHVDTYGFADNLDSLEAGDVCLLYNSGKGVGGYFIIGSINIINTGNSKTADIKINNVAISSRYIGAKELKDLLGKDFYIGGKITKFELSDGIKIIEHIGELDKQIRDSESIQ